MAHLKTYGSGGQYFWFASGIFAGVVIPALVETAFFPAFRIPPHDLPVPLLIPAWLFFSAIPSIFYAAWIKIREWCRGGKCELPWPWPLAFGVLYSLVAFGPSGSCASCRWIMPLLDWIPNSEWRDALAGITGVCSVFGLPVLFGEIAFRIAAGRIHPG